MATYTHCQIKKKYEQYTGGIFDGLEWTGKFVIGGCIIPACAYETESPENYPYDDIDIICKSQSIYEFMQCVTNISKTVQTNIIAKVINTSHNVTEHSKISTQININTKKSVYINISINFVKSLVSVDDEVNEIILNEIAQIESNSINQPICYRIENELLKLYVYLIYLKFKTDNDIKYSSVFGVDDITIMVWSDITADKGTEKEKEADKEKETVHDIVLTYSDVNKVNFSLLQSQQNVNDTVNKPCMKIREHIDCVISSDHMERNINVIMIHNDSYEKYIRQFNSRVHGFYNGTNLCAFASCDVWNQPEQLEKPFYSTDPNTIVEKYRKRGKKI